MLASRRSRRLDGVFLLVAIVVDVISSNPNTGFAWAQNVTTGSDVVGYDANATSTANPTVMMNATTSTPAPTTQSPTFAPTFPPPPPECYLCGVGNEMTLPEKKIPLRGDYNCRNLQEDLFKGLNSTACLSVTGPAGFFGLDAKAYCGCPGHQNQNRCGEDLCRGRSLDPNKLELVIENTTCRTWGETFQNVMLSEDNCTVFDGIRESCCEILEECRLCGPTGVLPNPNKTLYVTDLGEPSYATCEGAAEFLLYTADPNLFCIDTSNVNWWPGSFCECPGYSPKNSCGHLCEQDGASLADPNRIVQIEGIEGGMTCSEWADYFAAQGSTEGDGCYSDGWNWLRTQCCTTFPEAYVCGNALDAMAAPDKPLKGTYYDIFSDVSGTCQQYQDGRVLRNDLNEIRKDNGEFDYMGYCECPGKELLNTCNDRYRPFCPDNNNDPNLNPEKNYEGLTCQQWNDWYNSPTSDYYCNSYDFVRNECCEPPPPQECYICDAGAEMTKPNKLIPLRGNFTCRDLQNEWLAGRDSGVCLGHKDSDGYFGLDTQAYCGCPGKADQRKCGDELCRGRSMNMENLDTLVDEVTCRVWSDTFLSALTDDCNRFSAVREKCCEVIEECRICGGSDLPKPDKQLYIDDIGDPFYGTCAGAKEYLLYTADPNVFCTDTSNPNWWPGAYCECPGYSPRNACGHLCEHDGASIEDPNRIVELPGVEGGMTCSEWSDQFRAVAETENDGCYSDGWNWLRTQCCSTFPEAYLCGDSNEWMDGGDKPIKETWWDIYSYTTGSCLDYQDRRVEQNDLNQIRKDNDEFDYKGYCDCANTDLRYTCDDWHTRFCPDEDRKEIDEERDLEGLTCEQWHDWYNSPMNSDRCNSFDWIRDECCVKQCRICNDKDEEMRRRDWKVLKEWDGDNTCEAFNEKMIRERNCDDRIQDDHFRQRLFDEHDFYFSVQFFCGCDRQHSGDDGIHCRGGLQRLCERHGGTAKWDPWSVRADYDGRNCQEWDFTIRGLLSGHHCESDKFEQNGIVRDCCDIEDENVERRAGNEIFG